MKSKKFILVVTENDVVSTKFCSKSRGFSALEILGILECKRVDILKQMDGLIKPPIFSRKVEIE